MKPHTFISHPPQGNRATTAAANVLAPSPVCHRTKVPLDLEAQLPVRGELGLLRVCSRLARDARERRAAAVSDLGPIAFEKTYAVKYA